MIVSLLLITMAVVALPAPAPPTRANTSWRDVGLSAWLVVEPSVPTSISDLELVVPASMSSPASFTPSTSPTLMAVTPLSGTIVARPRPSATVSARSMLIVWSTW